jgi:hypothetical protein
VLTNTGQRAGVQGLHQQGTDASDQGREVCVHYPGGLIWQVKTSLFTLGNLLQPWRLAVT